MDEEPPWGKQTSVGVFWEQTIDLSETCNFFLLVQARLYQIYSARRQGIHSRMYHWTYFQLHSLPACFGLSLAEFMTSLMSVFKDAKQNKTK